MTDTTTEIEPAAETTPTGDPTTTPPPAEVETEPRPGSEAARYRVKLRETEVERDALAAHVERLQRAEVERTVADRLSVPGDLFTVGQVQLAALLDEAGDVVPALVDTALLGLLHDRPGLAYVPPKTYDLGQGRRAPVPAGASWSTVIKGR